MICYFIILYHIIIFYFIIVFNLLYYIIMLVYYDLVMLYYYIKLLYNIILNYMNIILQYIKAYYSIIYVLIYNISLYIYDIPWHSNQVQYSNGRFLFKFKKCLISPEASRFHSNVLSKSRQSHRAIDAATSTCARHQRRGRCCRRCLAEDATAAIKMEMLSMLSMKMDELDEHGDVFTCFYYHMLNMLIPKLSKFYC